LQAIAIGTGAGNNQGSYSIAIGASAGNSQPVNSIVINATGANLTAPGANVTIVKPIRRVTGTAGLYPLYYDSTTGEIVYYQP
jgi:hypothetical protein